MKMRLWFYDEDYDDDDDYDDGNDNDDDYDDDANDDNDGNYLFTGGASWWISEPAVLPAGVRLRPVVLRPGHLLVDGTQILRQVIN